MSTIIQRKVNLVMVHGAHSPISVVLRKKLRDCDTSLLSRVPITNRHRVIL